MGCASIAVHIVLRHTSLVKRSDSLTGREIVPRISPANVVGLVARPNTWSVPVAPAKRPVPPVMIFISSKNRISEM